MTGVVWSARLPANVAWSGKKSMSHGETVFYDAASRRLSWRAPSLAPHEDAYLGLELSLMLDESHIGTTPALLEQIVLTARDEYIGEDITVTNGEETTALPADDIGRSKGTAVIP